MTAQQDCPKPLATKLLHVASCICCKQVVGDRSSVKEYLRLLSSALALVKTSEAADMAKVKPFAVEAVKAFIRSPDIFQCDFWELPAVQQLSREPSSATLLKLLDVMLNGDLAGMLARGLR